MNACLFHRYLHTLVFLSYFINLLFKSDHDWKEKESMAAAQETDLYIFISNADDPEI
jgi:hypothetical protein